MGSKYIPSKGTVNRKALFSTRAFKGSFSQSAIPQCPQKSLARFKPERAALTERVWPCTNRPRLSLPKDPAEIPSARSLPVFPGAGPGERPRVSLCHRCPPACGSWCWQGHRDSGDRPRALLTGSAFAKAPGGQISSAGSARRSPGAPGPAPGAVPTPPGRGTAGVTARPGAGAQPVSRAILGPGAQPVSRAGAQPVSRAVPGPGGATLAGPGSLRWREGRREAPGQALPLPFQLMPTFLFPSEGSPCRDVPAATLGSQPLKWS